MTQDEFFVLLEEDFGISKTDGIFDTKLSNLNLDSLDFAQLKYLLEGKARVKFTPEEEKQLPNITINQLLRRLEVCTS